MSVPVAVRPEAREDILSGQRFFDRCVAGLGAEFVDDVLDALNRIGDMPQTYGEIDFGVRAKTIKRFGYVVYYRLLDNSVEVIAILHGARDPAEWQRRVQE